MSKIQVNEIVNHFDNGAPDCPKGLTVTGFTTFSGGSSFSGDVSIGGTLTYEDVTNIDSVGIITAQSGVHYGIVGSGVTIDAVGAGTSLGFLISGSERVRIDNSGRLLVGTSSPPPANTSDVLIRGATGSGGAGGLTITRINSTPANNNSLGSLYFADSNANPASRIESQRDGGTWTSGSSQPSRLIFYTTADGASSPTERMRIKNNGYIYLGEGFNNNNHRINGVNDVQGDIFLVISAYQSSGGSTSDTAEFFGCGAFGANISATGIRVGRNTGTNRSINAGGTINASGSDYAEYMTKSGDFTIAKGDVCGVNSQGKLTNVFADAVSFVVKSTNPSYVGGDNWDVSIGEKPGGYNDNRTEEEIAAATVVFEQELETARQAVDRIAFCGQVPVNVTNAIPGQFIIPVETDDGGISGIAKNQADLTFEEYMLAVGKVIAIEDDGRARIIVKIN